jgi:hypothetical protein
MVSRIKVSSICLAALAVAALSAAPGVAGASIVTTVTTVTGPVATLTTVSARGGIVVGGVSETYELTSNDPLIADPAASGPAPASPTGDHLLFGGYDFALTQPSFASFAVELLNPYDTWTVLFANFSAAKSPGASFDFNFLLPSVFTPTVSFNADGMTYDVNQPADYDIADLDQNPVYQEHGDGTIYSVGNGETIKLIRSGSIIRYSGGSLFNDPGMSGVGDSTSFTGVMTVTKVAGGLFVSDSSTSIIHNDNLTGPAAVMTVRSTESGYYSGPIPEPGTYALMILGVGATGAALRRRSPGVRPRRLGAAA